MKRGVLYVFCALLAIFGTERTFGASYVYQEPLGEQEPYQMVVGRSQYIGVRFQLNSPTQITSLHTVFGTSDSTFFAALVSLPSVTSLPHGDPFNPGEVVFSTVFQSPSPDDLQPIDIPFNVAVGPGAYAVVLGGGQFGSDGAPWGAVDTYQSVSDSSGFWWADGSSPATRGWHDNAGMSDTDTMLMQVEGTVVPEPSVAGLIGLGVVLAGCVRFLKRHRS